MDPDLLLADLTAGKTAALARAISAVENGRPGFERLLAGVHRSLGRARRIGITGPPGAGKSTLVERLVARLPRGRSPRRRGRGGPHQPLHRRRPPGRPHPHGIRRAGSTACIIRSMATRGSPRRARHQHRARSATCSTPPASIGSSSRRWAWVSRSSTSPEWPTATVLVLVPESGDGIQTLKSGVMEAADIFVDQQGRPPGSRQAPPRDRDHPGHPAGERLPQHAGAPRPRGAPRHDARRAGAV